MEQLEVLRRQYYALYPLYQLRLPPAQFLATSQSQSYLLSRILDDPLLSRYPPEAGYQKSFWRRVVAELESGLEDDGDAASLVHSAKSASTQLIN
jgi:hypothetical protein